MFYYMLNWEKISYLKNSNEIQKKAYDCLTTLKIFKQLSVYKPILVGTIPIDINIRDSDLDIICQISDYDDCVKTLNFLYSAHSEFYIEKTGICVTCSFFYNGFTIEIYAEKKPVLQQKAYLHMITEHRIFKLADKSFKQGIIELKKAGLKTEPAFGYLLDLKNAYVELLDYANKTDDEILHILYESDWEEKFSKITHDFETM